jgi:hypothetical protein
MIIFVRGECSRCGQLIRGSTADPDGDTANLFLIVPGQGAFKGTVFMADLVCKNTTLCGEREEEGTGGV